jgi:hypothetical protein
MKKLKQTLPAILLVIALTACPGQVLSGIESEDSTILDESLSNDTAVDQGYTEIVSNEADTSAAVSEEHIDLHEDSDDYSWDADSLVSIELNGDSITTASPDAVVDGTTATITAAGNYSIIGTLSDGQIIVDTEDEDIVRLILDNVDIHSSTNAAIYIEKADKVLIVLADGSQNILSDEREYILPDAESDEPNATLFSKADLTITGSGSLTISANYNDAIASKDGLIITGGSNITITAVDDGIRSKDYIVINGATIKVTAGGDGLKSDETDDGSKGFVTIESGTMTITAGADAIDAETDVTILGGVFDLTSGGGSGTNTANMESSAKGIIGGTSVTISGGIFNINAADDAVHSNSTILIQGGDMTIASGDDGMHSDSTLTIDGGTINITKSYEGLESAVITIDAGDIQIVSSDDGINLAGGADGSGMNLGAQGRMDGKRGGHDLCGR